MRTKEEIASEIRALKRLKPVGPHSLHTHEQIRAVVEELEYGIDQTAEEWDELDDSVQDIVNQTLDWKQGLTENKPSEGWEGLVQ